MVELPNVERAVVEPAKLRDYLLSPTHPIGRFKASFFASLGYEASAWPVLAADLRAQHLRRPPSEIVESGHGRKYVIRANLTGPTGQSALVVSVWIILASETYPRFVTAYPGAH